MKFLICLAFLSTISMAEIHEVKMLNKGSDGEKMVFEPDFLKVKMGDSVKFIPVDKGHNVYYMKEKEALPDGVDKKDWKGKINKELTVKIDKEGVYVYQCKPHYAMGMIGMVVAGKPVNLESTKKIKFRGISKKRAVKLLEEAAKIK